MIKTFGEFTDIITESSHFDKRNKKEIKEYVRRYYKQFPEKYEEDRKNGRSSINWGELPSDGTVIEDICSILRQEWNNGYRPNMEEQELIFTAWYIADEYIKSKNIFLIKKFKKFVTESLDQLDFEPILWGVEIFDDEMEDDKGISVTLQRSAGGGRELIESHWKVYAIEDLDDRWNVKAICIDSEDRRYQPDDEIDFEVNKNDNVLDLESLLHDALDKEGF